MANDSKSLELQIRIAAAEAHRAVSTLKNEVQNLAAEAKKFAGTDGAALEKSFKGAEAEAKKTAQGIFEIKNAVGSLAEVAIAAKALSVIKDMGAFALQAADNFQTARNQFGILLGDMKAGAGLFNEIKDFNDKTPFDLDTLTQVTNVLIAAKVPLSDLQSQLKKFGDLSQGSSQKLTSYINAFSQASAKGKADMQVLNTYLHQGVPILDALAKGFGVTTAEVVEMSSQGQISFADFSAALDSLTAAGGQYFGGMELNSKSLAAMQEGLKEATISLAASFGEMLRPAAIAVLEALTWITNAINDSPLVKSFLAAALVMITGLLGAMAVKATIAFAAQMSLNFATGVMNPVVLAATIAVAGLAAGYTLMAAEAQKAEKASQSLALAQQRQREEANRTNETSREWSARSEHIRQLRELNLEATLYEIERLKKVIEEKTAYYREMGHGFAGIELDMLRNAMNHLQELRSDFIKEFYDASTEDKIKELRERISVAQTYSLDINISSEDRNHLEKIIKDARDEIDRLSGDIENKARKWKEDWAGVWNKFQADQANNPFYDIELERKKKLDDAYNNYIRTANKETLDQVNYYYDTQRKEVIENLAKEEARLQRELSKTKIDDLKYEKSEALRIIEELQDKQIFAAEYNGEDIQKIRDRFQDMWNETNLKFDIEINTAKLNEARESIKDWQQELSDNLVLALMNIKIFGDQAAVVIGELSAQLAELSASAALSGFEEFGRALGEGERFADSLSRALASMCQQILQQLPMMFLQAGLQLIANGQWPLGLGFIAAAGSSAIISGYVDGASKHAQGGVFDEYGKAARAFAAGGTFTNQIVSSPTYFQHGGGLGLMGEAGPEAIMPLKRMPSGNLGVETNGGTGAIVTVNIINKAGVEVRKEEHEDMNGGRQIDITIGEIVNSHIASGKADRVMGSHFGLRAVGV